MVLVVSEAAVLGAGVMGARIAEVLAINGVNVVLKDVDDAALGRGLSTINKDLDDLAQFQASKGDRLVAEFEQKSGLKLTDEQRAAAKASQRPTFDVERKKRALAKIRTTTGFDGFDNVDLVIEAAPENLALKKKIFAELVTKVGDGAVLATNTSTLSITDVASALPPARRGRFLGVHFFNPPTTLPLIEVIPGAESRADIVEDVINFLTPMRNHRYPLVPIQVKECPGFLVNRILAPMLQEAFACYEEGIAKPRDIDLAMQTGAGFPMGPLALADLVGLDVIQHAGQSIATQRKGQPPHEVKIVQELVSQGRLGQKSGRGFYDYSNKT